MNKHCFDTTGLHDLIDIMDKDSAGEISYHKFKEAITPVTPAPKCGKYEGSFEAKETQKMAWLESLLEVLTRLLHAQADHDAICEKFQLNAAELFEQMDSYKVGYITSAAFARWVHINCGYHLSETDLLVLMPVFDDNRNHRIERDEFYAAVNAPDLTPDDDVEEGEINKKEEPKAATKAEKTAQ
jgi:Ca2+-binding EF-hand superfamily protein